MSKIEKAVQQMETWAKNISMDMIRSTDGGVEGRR